MVNLLTANVAPINKRYSLGKIKVLLNAQVENSLELGWSLEDIVVLANFDYEYMGVKSNQIKFDTACLTGSKMYGVRYALKDDVVWSHDLDAWQNVWFGRPDIKNVGAATYDNHKFNGGSIFWKPSSVDIVGEVISKIEDEDATYEENVLNRVFRLHKNRVTKLNYTYNVGCSNYRQRWTRSDKPIKVAHFHPYNRIAWETHALDRCKLGTKGISDRLERLLRRHYILAKELKSDN